MIGSIQGEIQAVVRDTIIVGTSGGVGYRVHTTADTVASAHTGSHIFLWTHLAVRENAHDLYGFDSRETLRWFELLLTVSGIGPRSALAVLNSVGVATLVSAITRQDASALSYAVGVGKKTAEKIILELKEKVEPEEEGAVPGSVEGEIIDALISLGYSAKEAREAAQGVSRESVTLEESIREAIRLASKHTS
jgi:holliday junction DNA helicase RuvA